jgi:hypothetical protein
MMVFGVVEANAVAIGRVELHGFGGWAYGRTDNENDYLVGNEDGNYENVDFALNIAANPYERFSLHIQPSYIETNDGDEVGLDYAFAEVLFSEAAILRIGKVKVPFMLYTEVYKVGTIRPFFTLPQGVYLDATAEAYKGFGLTGSLYVAGSWEFLYDVYGGKINLQPTDVLAFHDGQVVLVSFETSAREMIGGRLIVRLPIEGLSLGLASYIGDFEVAFDGVVQEDFSIAERTLFIGTFAEYLSDRWWIRSEYVMQRENPEISEDIVYCEIAYMLTQHWQLAARYEFLDMDVTAPEFQYLPEPSYRHEDMAFGLNYWLNPNFVVKLSYHRIDGNRFASPDEPENIIRGLLAGDFEEMTQLFLIGVQFSF